MVVVVVKGGGGGDAKLCSVTGRSFPLRQLNCGKRGSMVALPFVLPAAHAEHVLIKDANTHFSIRHIPVNIVGKKYSLKNCGLCKLQSTSF